MPETRTMKSRRPSRVLLSTLALSAVALSSPPSTISSIAQKEVTQAEYLQSLMDSGQRSIEVILKAFEPHFPSSKRHLLNSEKVYVSPHSSFTAYADYNSQKILIPVQVVLEAHLQAHAYIYVENDPSAAPQFNPYLQYLSERSNDVFIRIRKGEIAGDDLPIKSFWIFANLPPPKFKDGDKDVIAKLMTSSLATVVGHELGHLALEHKPYKDITLEQSRQQEFDADAFAVRLIHSAGESVIPGLLTIYLRFVTSEHLLQGAKVEAGTHPAAICRLYRMFKKEYDVLRNTPAGKNLLESRSGMTLEQVDSLMDQTKESCS
ncbi:MAG: hypothetical protein ACKVP3_02715 [Hyphomicrobiaceae bacterium]